MLNQTGLVIGYTTAPFILTFELNIGPIVNNCWSAECTLGNFAADALRNHTGAQIAFVNAGSIRYARRKCLVVNAI